MTFRYECPYCGSLRKPRVVSYFPPKIVQCVECLKKGTEKEFTKDDDKYGFSPLPQYH